jgi:hypothetical protein
VEEVEEVEEDGEQENKSKRMGRKRTGRKRIGRKSKRRKRSESSERVKLGQEGWVRIIAAESFRNLLHVQARQHANVTRASHPGTKQI